MNRAGGRYGNETRMASPGTHSAADPHFVTKHGGVDRIAGTHQEVGPDKLTQAEAENRTADFAATPVTSVQDLDHIGGQPRIDARKDAADRKAAEEEQIKVLKAAEKILRGVEIAEVRDGSATLSLDHPGRAGLLAGQGASIPWWGLALAAGGVFLAFQMYGKSGSTAAPMAAE